MTYVKKTNRTRVKRRAFTRADDELIMQQPQGGYSVSKLEDLLHASRETIERRAQELNVVLHIQKRHNPSSYNRHSKSQPDEVLPERVHMHDSGGNPCSVNTLGDDPLLHTLYNEHGDRRYGTVQQQVSLGGGDVGMQSLTKQGEDR